MNTIQLTARASCVFVYQSADTIPNLRAWEIQARANGAELKSYPSGDFEEGPGTNLGDWKLVIVATNQRGESTSIPIPPGCSRFETGTATFRRVKPIKDGGTEGSAALYGGWAAAFAAIAFGSAWALKSLFGRGKR